MILKESTEDWNLIGLSIFAGLDHLEFESCYYDSGYMTTLDDRITERLEK
jgi:hypothetical protein